MAAKKTTSPFEAYGELARLDLSATVKAGRARGQEAAEALIPHDIEVKLGFEPSHRLLEIGCGPGFLLEALSPKVASSVGVDHPEVIANARKTCRAKNVTFIAGQFPDVKIDGRFDRIVIYSVLHYLADFEAIARFIDGAVELLAPQGKLLAADIPNTDMKKRFMESDSGKTFHAEWIRQLSQDATSGEDPAQIFRETISIRALDDSINLRLVERYRKAGLNAFLMPQPPALPFGHTREDMLIARL
jgi:2-polyprenyl-3-methyl-5-hydroxy-6-metoxy-1,4-benzoquinol methylase